MKKIINPSFFLLLLVASSCVTNKQYVYLQKGDVNGTDLPIDSVVRNYRPKNDMYQVQYQDLLSVRFESLTSKEFDFLNQIGVNEQNTANFTQGNALLIGDLVDPNGEIPFPFLGSVKVAGLTVFEIQEKLQGLADEYLDSPVVKVRLLNYRFTVLGEVKREGTVTVPNNQVTIIEAIGLAGGLTDLAEKANVKLIRERDGMISISYINLLDENFINSPYYYLYQNDIIIVPALRQRPFRIYFKENLSLAISSLSLLLIAISLLRN